MTMPPVINWVGIGREYLRPGNRPVRALSEITFTIEPGEFVVIRGPSGCGKSSLLNILGCLDQPTTGQYFLLGENVAQGSDQRMSGIRNARIGFVFQAFHLLPRTSALENVLLPLMYRKEAVDPARGIRALERVGLQDRIHHYPAELSGGEQQRVAIARALVTEPPLILADEPTGNLDQAAGQAVMNLLRALHQEGRTIVLVTHDDAVASYADREITLRDGQVQTDRAIAKSA